jgi:UDP-GlcNAc:undecaprenyl-phosphate GlcNAc-1-phosphate transferase
MENLVNLFFVHISINILIFIFKDYLKKKINIYDYPDFKKKLHKRPIPLIGGWILLFNLIFFLFSSYSQLSILEIKIILCSFFFLIIGALDDKYQLSSYTKISTLLVALIIFFNFNENLIINNLKIYNYNIYLDNHLGLFFSILCVLLFVNAFNLFDGINLQSSLYGFYLLLFLFFKSFFVEIIFIILIALILIVYLNHKNRIFMGDSGTLFLGFVISVLIIANYNIKNSLKVDEIFLLMFLPGVDMFRLFVQRILGKKNPFLGDREHLHHYLLKIYGYNYAIFLTLGIAILPSLLNFFFDSRFLILFFIIFYLFLFIFLKKKINKSVI